MIENCSVDVEPQTRERLVNPCTGTLVSSRGPLLHSVLLRHVYPAHQGKGRCRSLSVLNLRGFTTVVPCDKLSPVY